MTNTCRVVTGWKRVGLSLTLLWLLGVLSVVGYEWFNVPRSSGYFVKAVVEKTGEQYRTSDYGEFADLVPVSPRLRVLPFTVALVLPVAALWLVGFLLFWVKSGFRREQN